MSEFHQYSPNVRNSITYSLEKGSLTNYNIDISKIVFTGLIFLYIFFYPPFRSSGIAALIPIRLTIETLVLIFLLIKTQMIRPGKLQVNLLWAVLCILIFSVFSPEAIRNVLSFFNKILFFLLLIKILEFDNKLFVMIRNLWVHIWYVMGFFAIMAIISYKTGLLPFYDYILGSYQYYHSTILGSITHRATGTIILPRYVGWMFEHGHLAYYFSLNYILSDTIYRNKYKYNWFRLVNLIGGLLTLSFSFYLFYLFYFILYLLKKIKLQWLFLLIIPGVIYFGFQIYQRPEILFFTSMSDRVWRVEGALDIISKMNIMELLIGLGTFQSMAALKGGFAVGILSMLAGRGFLLTIFFIFLMIKYTKYNKTLLVFIVYYNFIFGDMFLYPVSLLIIALGYCSYNHGYFLNNHHLTRKFSISR